ncbi:sigma-70 family RNA polymerase sigma factor [Roseomonas sp. BN140053]|uniref:sigma-70 family RNA polymerase sigma factor n=1 Tax=Roseomonas sp. BN140053 TaxID=3391898 RepID=UPI0039E80AF6
MTRSDPGGRPPPSEEELARQIRSVAERRDRDAFRTLFSHYGPRLRTYFFRLGAPAAVADDLVQDTMLAVWRKAEQFDPRRGNAGAWVFTIARNARITGVRQDQRIAALEGNYGLDTEEPREPEELLLQDERVARLHRVLGDLSQEQNNLLKLAFFQDKSHTEIMRDQGMPLGTVKSHLRRLLQRMRAALERNE